MTARSQVMTVVQYMQIIQLGDLTAVLSMLYNGTLTDVPQCCMKLLCDCTESCDRKFELLCVREQLCACVVEPGSGFIIW